MYRQARHAIRQLADPLDAPIECFALKHVFRKAAKLGPETKPKERVDALQKLANLLQGIQAKFCQSDESGKKEAEHAEEESDAELEKVLEKLENLATILIGKRDTIDYDLNRQPSEDLLDCQTCGGRVRPGPNIRQPWAGATCSLETDDVHF